MNIISFDEVKRGDTVKCLEGPESGFTFKVHNRRLARRLLIWHDRRATGTYRMTVSNCDRFELVSRSNH